VTDKAADPDGCAFCAIARGEDPAAEVICEGEAWVAFFPLKPATPGHTLVIPRRHVPDFLSADPPLAAELAVAVVHVGRAIEAALTPPGMNVITSSGLEAEQTVFHWHVHLLPRYLDDGFDPIWPPKGEFKDLDLEGVADRIREVCRSTLPDKSDDRERRDAKEEVEPEEREAEDRARP
jgi:histidine triad (HIT) family protein